MTKKEEDFKIISFFKNFLNYSTEEFKYLKVITHKKL